MLSALFLSAIAKAMPSKNALLAYPRLFELNPVSRYGLVFNYNFKYLPIEDAK